MSNIAIGFILAILLPISINGDNGINLPGSCQQPPNTSVLIYNKDDLNILTQHSAGECECPSDPTKKIVFFSPGAQTPPTGKNAGASPIAMQCNRQEDFCVCDESDVCWTLKNAYAELIINSYCDPSN